MGKTKDLEAGHAAKPREGDVPHMRHSGKEGKAMLLAGDIGGTKTNLALFSPGAGRPRPLESRHLATGDYPSPQAMIQDFLRGRHRDVFSTPIE